METKNTAFCHPERSRGIPWTSRKFGWFTLVELIVVITILVILGTIAFLNLGNFSSWARDSGRVSDLANISKGLDLMYVKNGTVLPPEAGTNAGVVNLYASGVLIGQQWAVGTTILSAIKMGWDGKDPVDKKSYTYLVNADRTKHQLLALAEDSSNVIGLNSLTDRAYAGYESRYPMTKGASLGVLLGSTGATLNQPIQENYSVSTFTGVELFTATGWLYNAVLSSKSTLSGTGNALLPMVANLDTGAGYYPGCNTPNIRLPNGQVWAACNVGAGKAYNGESITDCGGGTTDCNASIRSVMGWYFQWGRNEDVTSLGTGETLAATGTLASAKLGLFIVGTDWIASSNSNLWWGSWTTTATGTFLTQGSPTAMQWPCENGYHVPTIREWCNAFNNIDPSVSSCAGGWTNTTLLATALRLPLTGRRSTSATFHDQWSVGWYYSSSPIGANGINFAIERTRIFQMNSNPRSAGNSIRCLKN